MEAIRGAVQRVETALHRGPEGPASPHGVDRQLLEKLQWHRGYTRIAEQPVPDEELAKNSLLHPSLYSREGTAAIRLSAPSLAGIVHMHRGGRFEGHIFGIKGGIAEHYHQARGEETYGLPISDEYEVPEGWRSDFEGHSLVATRDPWNIQEVDRHSIDHADLIAAWSGLNLKKFSEPDGGLKEASPSLLGTEAIYMEFREVKDPHLHSGILKHLSGEHIGGIVALRTYDWEYYLSLGGSRSHLGLPLPQNKEETDERSVIAFENGEIIWTPSEGFSYSLR